jgi:hypothetical protein
MQGPIDGDTDPQDGEFGLGPRQVVDEALQEEGRSPRGPALSFSALSTGESYLPGDGFEVPPPPDPPV